MKFLSAVRARPMYTQVLVVLPEEFMKVLQIFVILNLFTAAVFAQTDNIGAPVNTEFDEFSPALPQDASYIIFNSKRTERGYMDLYKSDRVNGAWQEPQLLNELNSRYNDETPFLSPDGSFIIFASDRDGSTEMPKDAAGRIRVSFDLYISYKKDGKFQPPIRLPGSVNSVHHEKSAAISEDGKKLYFTRYPFADISASKIYVADITDKGFVNPRPLPEKINSGHSEVNLTVAYGKNGFYFSSKRPGGFGSWDIWFISHTTDATGEKETWGEPQNMGERVNSAASENYLYEINNAFWFCSTKQGGLGRFDIYGVPSAPAEKKLTFRVIRREDKTPVQTTADLTATLGEQTGKVSKTTDGEGRFEVALHPDLKRIEASVNVDGFLPWFGRIDLNEIDTEKEILISLDKLKKDQSFHTQVINFDFNSARLKKDSIAYLEGLANFLNTQKEIKLEIIGHTDDVGPDDFNLKLSAERASAVKAWLVQNGVDAFRLQTSGAGETRPLMNETTPQARALNRRTEFKIIK